MKITKIHIWEAPDFGKMLPARWIIDIEVDEDECIKFESETEPIIYKEEKRK